MKKILILFVCILMVCVFPLSAYAEETNVDTPPVEEPTHDVDWGEVKQTVSGYIESWVLPHIEEIAVIITLIMNCIYNARKHKLLNKSVVTLNNNAITVAENSATSMSDALAQMQSASGAVTQYDERITKLLNAFNTIMEENQTLRSEFAELKKYLHSSAESNIEFANELAELLSLSNIPNYKKEELGARHVASVDAIRLAEAQAESIVVGEEVKENDGEET